MDILKLKKEFELSEIQKVILNHFINVTTEKNLFDLDDDSTEFYIFKLQSKLKCEFGFPDCKLNPNKLGSYKKDFEKFGLKLHINDDTERAFTLKLMEGEAKKLLQLIDKLANLKYDSAGNINSDYRKNKNLLLTKKRDADDFVKEVIAELKKCRTPIAFELLANTYGCNSLGKGYREFNDFLRKNNISDISPSNYARAISDIYALRRGIAKNNFLADKDITLYRYTSHEAILGMLGDIGILKKDFEETTYKEKGRYFIEYRDELYELLENLLNAKKPTISDPAFLSTSKDPTVTRFFGEVRLIIKVKKGTAIGADLTNLSGHPHQEEVLLIPGQKLKVLSAKHYQPALLNPNVCFEILMETAK